MRIAITGAAGLVGSALIKSLTARGDEVIWFTRTQGRAGEIYWQPTGNVIEREKLEGLDAIVHLAGESVVGGFWTAAHKARIRDSRVQGTRLLAETMASLSRPPRVFVSASATGYYGSRGDESLREESAPGSDFLAQVTREWEAAADLAAAAQVRIVKLRIGMVLSTQGGALAKMLLPFKLGLGGRFGNGRQYMSWILLDDLIKIIHFVIANERISGPVNAVSPNPVTNREYTATLARVLARPAFFPIPACPLRWLLGEMADALFFASLRVHPGRLLAADFNFQYPDLGAALQHELKE